MVDKPKEVKKMAGEGERASWMDPEGGEGDQLRAKAGKARAVLGVAVGRAEARSAPRQVTFNALLGRKPASGDAVDAVATLEESPLIDELVEARKELVKKGLASS